MVKTIQDKLYAEVAAHGRMREERDKLHEEGTKKEATNTTLREAAQKKRVRYDEHLVHEHQLNHDVEVRLNREMSYQEELHERESQIWVEMKKHYEEAATTDKRKIENLKKALEDIYRFTRTWTQTVSAPFSKQNGNYLRPNYKRLWTTTSGRNLHL